MKTIRGLLWLGAICVTVGGGHLTADIQLVKPINILVNADGTLSFAQNHGFSGQVNAATGVASHRQRGLRPMTFSKSFFRCWRITASAATATGCTRGI